MSTGASQMTPAWHPGYSRCAFPESLIKLYAWFYRYVLRDPVYASLVEGWNVKDGQEFYRLVGQRYRAEWFEYWKEEKLDLVLTVPNALPAIKDGDSKRLWKACGSTTPRASCLSRAWTALSMKFALPHFRPRNKIECDTYTCYDAKDTHGLPVGVQIVGRRLEEEKALEGMKLIEGLLKRKGIAYTHMSI